eukprot:CAMPEP_0114998116 /NCGR_PEP_ID=MMETSP0216-20121206/15307_1 /TAXON_ID=223996 /ORGANISM="Protocruzia adherens, Strain Boccale" /LENGTH=726 /DNA_ID=CAMNT_0002362635 /DNA_START=37 /DNA_END=2217 /DNA_ORIENTATION=+
MDNTTNKCQIVIKTNGKRGSKSGRSVQLLKSFPDDFFCDSNLQPGPRGFSKSSLKHSSGIALTSEVVSKKLAESSISKDQNYTVNIPTTSGQFRSNVQKTAQTNSKAGTSETRLGQSSSTVQKTAMKPGITQELFPRSVLGLKKVKHPKSLEGPRGLIKSSSEFNLSTLKVFWHQSDKFGPYYSQDTSRLLYKSKLKSNNLVRSQQNFGKKKLTVKSAGKKGLNVILDEPYEEELNSNCESFTSDSGPLSFQDLENGPSRNLQAAISAKDLHRQVAKEWGFALRRESQSDQDCLENGGNENYKAHQIHEDRSGEKVNKQTNLRISHDFVGHPMKGLKMKKVVGYEDEDESQGSTHHSSQRTSASQECRTRDSGNLSGSPKDDMSKETSEKKRESKTSSSSKQAGSKTKRLSLNLDPQSSRNRKQNCSLPDEVQDGSYQKLVSPSSICESLFPLTSVHHQVGKGGHNRRTSMDEILGIPRSGQRVNLIEEELFEIKEGKQQKCYENLSKSAQNSSRTRPSKEEILNRFNQNWTAAAAATSRMHQGGGGESLPLTQRSTMRKWSDGKQKLPSLKALPVGKHSLIRNQGNYSSQKSLKNVRSGLEEDFRSLHQMGESREDQFEEENPLKKLDIFRKTQRGAGAGKTKSRLQLGDLDSLHEFGKNLSKKRVQSCKSYLNRDHPRLKNVPALDGVKRIPLDVSNKDEEVPSLGKLARKGVSQGKPRRLQQL